MLGLLLLAACAPNRVTPIAGVPFPVVSSFLSVEPGTFGTDDLVVVTLSSLEASCDAEAVFKGAAIDAETPEALAAAWAAAYPSTFREATLVARVPGGTWPPRNALWTGLAWDAFPEQNNVVFALFTEHLAHRDEAYWSGEGDADAYERTFLSDGGLVKWGASEPGLRLAGRFNSNVVNAVGLDRGTAEMHFDATICGL